MDQTSVITETKHGLIPVVHVHLALKTDDVKHLEESISECCPRLFPRSWKPSLTKYLVDRSVFRFMRATTAVCDSNVVNPVDVVDGEIAKGRDGGNTASTSMVQLYDESEGRKRRWLEHSMAIDLGRIELELVNGRS
jgi:hypothetical protein